ncbi:MAG: hypothetical protein ACLFNU_10585 [Bacteroidales bacterium]
MDNLSIDKFKELARISKPNCVSIFIPTHRAGKEVNELMDQKNLKNLTKKVRDNLYEYEVDKKTTDDLLKPIEDLIEDYGFWKHQSDGLAIFRNHDEFIYFTIPVYFDEFTYINDHFYLKPLLPYINDDDKFYLLALSLSGAKLYEGFPHRIDELAIEDIFPGNPEDVVGYDFKEKNLQFRTGQAEKNHALFHGHGGGKEEEKSEILKYFRAINEGVMKILQGKNVPLILATVDYLVPLYSEVNDYKHMEQEFISGNPEYEDPILLHEKAREILEEYFNRKRTEKASAFEQALSDAKASYKEEEIVPAAINQQVDTLFIRNREELWGVFDKNTNKIITRDNGKGQNSCLLNMAAVHTILNNGSAYLMDEDKMPEPKSKLNAIFRF